MPTHPYVFSKEAAPILYDEPMELIVAPRNPLDDVYYCAWFVFSEAMGGRCGCRWAVGRWCGAGKDIVSREQSGEDRVAVRSNNIMSHVLPDVSTIAARILFPEGNENENLGYYSIT